MKIIVLAHPKDDHAAPVQWALEQAGYQASCWSGVSWTEPERASLRVDEPLSINLGPHRLKQGDVLWLRQSDHQASLHRAGDRKSAARRLHLFLMSWPACLKACPSAA